MKNIFHLFNTLRSNMLVVRSSYILLFFCFSCECNALDVSWTPTHPGEKILRIEARELPSNAKLHWGVNAKKNNWLAADPVYHPEGSTIHGVATRSPLIPIPDEPKAFYIELGPFSHPTQTVNTVDFVFYTEDGQWLKNGTENYHVLIPPPRILFEPESPTLNDRITLRIRDGKAGGKLHWGVNKKWGEWQRPDAAYWPAVTSNSFDEVSVDTPLPKPDASGWITFKMGPFNKPEQVVHTFHAVVNFGEEWDSWLGGNYNLSIKYPSDGDFPKVIFRGMEHGTALKKGMTISLHAEGADKVRIFLEGTQLAEWENPPFDYTLHEWPEEFGAYTLLAYAENTRGVMMQEAEVWRLPPFDKKPLPEGATYGVTVREDEALFVLHAPGKHFVELTGDFTDGDYLHKAPNGDWWIRKKVSEGDHTYQYIIDGKKRISDPWAKNLSWKDKKGKETHVPEKALAKFTVPKPAFVWHDEAFVRPALNELIIYELQIRDITRRKGFLEVIPHLDYIKGLGVNAIELMPINEFPGDDSWGYNPAFHLAPESTYGTPEELKKLIDAAHQRGLAVILDIVLNHMDQNGALWQLYEKDYAASPYFYLFTGENWGFPDLEQQTTGFKRYACDVLTHWQNEYHIDGFRYDATRWVGWRGHHDWGAGWFAHCAKQNDPASIQIAEHLPTDPELFKQTEMDTGWHAHYRWRLREMITRATLDSAEFHNILNASRMDFASNFDRIVYLESHDEERLWAELQAAGYTEEDVLRRAILAHAILLTSPGVVMLYAGEEFGEDTKKTLQYNPVQWELQRMPYHARLLEAIKELISLRVTRAALKSENIRLIKCNSSKGIFAYEREGGGEKIIVAGNMSQEDYFFQEVNPSDVLFASDADSKRLKAGGALIWVERFR